MRFKLPDLGKLVLADKNVAGEDFRKLIHVVDGFAYVNNNLLAVVQLREYVRKECNIDDPDDIQELDKILSFLDGKSFTKSFWSELTSECDCTYLTDALEIKNEHYTSTLVYDEVLPIPIDFNSIKIELERDSEEASLIGLKSNYLFSIVDTFKKELKSGTIMFQLSGQANCLKFIGLNKSYIFGYMPLNFDSTQEMFGNFDNFSDFQDSL